ncbi:histidine kinase 5 isoform X2 [Rhododendron vialii]|uniref:histidine kinase 5 isoform X2 n=1 Tax=Rhododendron vialii TaxID=182163 RepID=UPI00265ED074|nr:histidine kinase 5 isoform X2 [Rhododendron vialii]
MSSNVHIGRKKLNHTSCIVGTESRTVFLSPRVCEMENDNVEELDVEGLSITLPDDINEAGKQFSIEKPGADQDILEEIEIIEEPQIVDFEHLVELTNYSEKGSSQLAYLVKNWDYRQANAVRLLRKELDNLSKQKQEVELKHLEILVEHRFEKKSSYASDKRPISMLDEVCDILPDFPSKIKDVVVENKGLEIEAEYDTVIYWKQRTRHFEELLEASIQREQILMEKLQESIKNLERQSPTVEELSQILKRADHFLHFILQTAPVVIGHQDKELRYCFIYNPYTTLHEEVRKREKMAKLREEIAVQKARETKLNKTIHTTGNDEARETKPEN